MFFNLIGNNNVAIGNHALYYNFADFQTAIGNYASYHNTSGKHNSAFGYKSLFTEQTGGYNTAIGNYALETQNGGQLNTGVGYKALGTNVGGLSNTAVGNYALFGNNGGNSNVGIGGGSLLNTTGSYNTSVGVNSGTTLIINGNNSTYIGYQRRGAGNKSTCIGANSGTSSLGLTGITCLGQGALASTNLEVRITTGLGSNMGITGSVCWIDTNILKVNGTTISSDKRIKTDIQSIDQGLTDSFLSIDPKIYTENLSTRKLGVVANDIPENVQPFIVTVLPKHFNEVGSRAKFSNNFRILGITGVPYEEINNWKSENKDIIQQSKLDWEFEYFDDFKTVDYSRLGTMVALATAKD